MIKLTDVIARDERGDENFNRGHRFICTVDVPFWLFRASPVIH